MPQPQFAPIEEEFELREAVAPILKPPAVVNEALEGERYFIRKHEDKPGASFDGDAYPSWRRVTKAQFVETNEQAYCGTLEEVKDQIAQAEDIPVACISGGPFDQSLSVNCETLEHLEPLLAYTKRTGQVVTAQHIRHNEKEVRAALPGRKVRTIYNYTIIVDEQWIIDSRIRHSKEAVEAADQNRVQKEANAKLAREEAARRGVKRMKGCRIPNAKVLWQMFDSIKKKLGETAPFKTFMLDETGYQYGTVVHATYPKGRRGIIAAIPVLAALYTRITGKSDYRGNRWRKAEAILKKKYLKDPYMTDELRKLIMRRTW